jgi:hypothetical protein
VSGRLLDLVRRLELFEPLEPFSQNITEGRDGELIGAAVERAVDHDSKNLDVVAELLNVGGLGPHVPAVAFVPRPKHPNRRRLA